MGNQPLFPGRDSLDKTKNLRRSLLRFFVDPLGLEPRMTDPESVVLPLHHGSMRCQRGKSNQKSFFVEGVTKKSFK